MLPCARQLLIMKMTMQKEIRQKYTVFDTRTETGDVTTIRLVPEEGPAPAYIPGQYVTVYFPETGTPEGKAYSISSVPEEGMVALTVKSMGEFSRRLVSLLPGDIITASLPYGYFYSESEETSVVLVAGGIGIVPFRSMITHSLRKNPARKCTLLYSARTKSDLVFRREFDELSKLHPAFQVHYFVTREPSSSSDMTYRRITGDDITSLIPDVSRCEFFLCGSISFVRDLWRNLRSIGIPEEYLYTEAFFSH